MSTTKATIVIGLDASIMITTNSGSFEGGSKKIAGLLEDLKAQGLDITLSGPPEQHNHDDPGHLARHEHLHTH